MKEAAPVLPVPQSTPDTVTAYMTKGEPAHNASIAVMYQKLGYKVEDEAWCLKMTAPKQVAIDMEKRQHEIGLRQVHGVAQERDLEGDHADGMKSISTLGRAQMTREQLVESLED